MKPKLQDILTLIDEMAPHSMAEEWDNSGLQVGDLRQKISKIIVALDPTMKTLGFALDTDAQLILTHHPLIFKPLTNITRDRYPGDVIFEAIQKDIAIIAAHTNLDAAKMGINEMLANLMGLVNIEPLEERETLNENGLGLGRIGALAKPTKLSVFTEDIKNLLGNLNLRFLGQEDREIKRVAVMGGAGGGYAALSRKKGADVLITGDVRHHEALDAQAIGLALIDAGHFYTERAALRRFTDFLRKKTEEMDWELVVEFYNDEMNPMEC